MVGKGDGLEREICAREKNGENESYIEIPHGAIKIIAATSPEENRKQRTQCYDRGNAALPSPDTEALHN